MENWNKEAEVARFEALWQKKKSTGMVHSAEKWNGRADGWVNRLTNNESSKRRSRRRVEETGKYLRSHGLLTAEDTVIDIGCGPGRFVAEFAKTCRHATGTDISQRMLDYGAEYALAQGLTNTAFVQLDFKEADLCQLGWEKAFDLVFSSITPAANTIEAVDKMERMSRKFCFSANFVRTEDTLAEEAWRYACPGLERTPNWSSQTFYSMLNLLWLRGRYPRVEYLTEEEDELMPADEELVGRIIKRIPEEYDTEETRHRVLEYVRGKANLDGMVTYHTLCRYGWLLWDVRDNEERQYQYNMK